jgi:DNA-binding transcriptional LysR family regulator
LKTGKLIAILDDHASPANPLQMMYPPGRAQPRRVKALAEELSNAMARASA